MTSPLDLDIAGLGLKIRAREITVGAVTQAAIARAKAWQPSINAFIDIRESDAMAQARILDDELAHGFWRGPLHGVPMAHKDMFHRTGRVSTCGADFLRDAKADVTATALARLDAAGAVDIGTLNMSEFAAGPTGHNEHHGHCRNPWNADHVSGGSSSGSGAAVAARIVHASLGSDTGGSIRIPASICGVVGLKPTYGAVSRFGAMPRSWTLDCFGPLTRSVADNRLVMRALCGADPEDPTSLALDLPDAAPADMRGLTLGVPRAAFVRDAIAPIADAFERALAALARDGTRIVDIDVPDPESFYGLSEIISKAEAAAYHAEWMETESARYSPQVKSRVESAFYIPAIRYIDALRLRGPVMRRFCDAAFGGCDAIATPTLTCATPRVDSSNVQTTGDVPALVHDFSRNTRPFNYLGLPAISVPAPVAEGALPCGVQFVGRPLDETTLYRFGAALEAQTHWHLRAPRLSA